MAKRTSSRSQAADASAQPESSTPQKRPTRRATRTVSEATSGEATGFEESRPTTPSELPDIPEPGDLGDRALRSESMSSSPTDEDIRLRAYHRYLQRGGSHGGHFNDWIEAEQELRRDK
jgi:Protein of unknown function (DUF2934)